MNAALNARLSHALNALQLGNVAEANQISRHLLQQFPEHADSLYLAGEVACAEKRWDDAIRHFRAAVINAAVKWPLYLREAELQLFLRNRDAARAAAAAARDAAGSSAAAWQMAGKAFAKANDIHESCKCHEMAAQLRPNDPGVLYDLATSHFFLGNLPAAETAIDGILAAGGDSAISGHASYLLATLRTQSSASNHVDALQRIVANTVNAERRMAAGYALAKELEDLADFDASADALARAATERRLLIKPDVQSEVKTMSEISSVWTSSACKPDDSDAGEGVIFVVGLPRTGTTLVESALLKDDRTVAAGELLDLPQLVGEMARARVAAEGGVSLVEASLQLDFHELGKDYVRGAREAAHGAAIFVDKLPVNFLYLGLIARALPKARIVHLTRHPLDAAWAIHKTLFGSAYLWSCDLEQVAEYIVAYHALMEHWKEVLPGRVLDVSYESFVADSQAQTARLLEWCGLEDSGRTAESRNRAVVTASAVQVRQKIHSRSVGRWRAHHNRLGAVIQRFEAAGLVAGDSL